MNMHLKYLAGPGNIKFDRDITLGRGGAAYVFAGTMIGTFDTSIIKVAIKRMQRDYKKEKQSQTGTNYRRELEVLKATKHKNIVRYFCHREDDNFFYLVMEQCNCSLHDYLKKNGLIENREALFKTLFQATSGLNHLHSKDILYRDLKPRNILVSINGNEVIIKLADFGISIFLDGNQTISSIKDAGTSGYKAAEIKREVVDKKSDIFSLGIFFCKCAAGESHPYGENAVDAQTKIEKQEEPTISEEIESLKLLIKKMLVHDWENRPDCESVMKDLSDIALRLGIDLGSAIESCLFGWT